MGREGRLHKIVPSKARVTPSILSHPVILWLMWKCLNHAIKIVSAKDFSAVLTVKRSSHITCLSYLLKYDGTLHEYSPHVPHCLWYVLEQAEPFCPISYGLYKEDGSFTFSTLPLFYNKIKNENYE